MHNPSRAFAVRIASLTAVVTLAGSALVSPAAFAATPTPPSIPVSVVYSSSDGSQKLTPQADLAVGRVGTSDITTIGIDPTHTGQSLDGIGGSLESSSVYNIAQLSDANRTSVMNALFDPESGNGYDLMRLSFGCPDFCSQPFYTYDDVPAGQTDPSFDHFSIQKDIDSEIVSVAQQALAVNPDVEFFASAWSPPAWMKDNQSLNNGGSILPQYYPALATYYRLAIQAYAEHGIPIKALTVNNEPLVVPDYPSAAWTWEQERDFVPFLRAELDSASLSTEIWIQDDNWWTTSQFANILADPTVGPMVDGVAVHDYDDGDVTQAAALVKQYPDITVRLTERSYYDVKGMDRLVQLFRNDVSSWTYWLTFLDEDGLPNEGPLDGDSFPQQIGAPHDDLNAWYLDRDYYLYGQFSRFLERGAVRISSDYGATNKVTDVVFRNPNGDYVAVVVNQTDYDQAFRLVSFDGQVADTLPAATVGTYTWRPSAVPLDRSGWSATASLQDWGSSLMLDGDPATGWRNYSAQASGQSITIDTGSVQLIDGLTLDSGTIDNGSSSNDWPRGYRVTSSVDGATWSAAIATGTGSRALTNITFPTVQARFFKVELTKAAPTSYWSVAEVYAFAGEAIAPSITATTTPATPTGANGWYVTSPVDVALELHQGTLASALEFSVDGGPWGDYTGPIAVTGDSHHSVGYRAVAGGTVIDASVGSVAVNVDTKAPTIGATLDSTTRTVTITAADATSGVGSVQYRLGSATVWNAYSQPVAAGDDAVTISYRATDVAGSASAEASLAVPAAVPLTVSALAQCSGGKAGVVVKVKNTGSTTVAARITTESSTKVTTVKAGATVSTTFPGKTSSLVAGTLTVVGTSVTNGTSTSSTFTASYAAIACK